MQQQQQQGPEPSILNNQQRQQSNQYQNDDTSHICVQQKSTDREHYQSTQPERQPNRNIKNGVQSKSVNNKLRIALLNIRSIRNKLSEFEILIEEIEHKPHIGAVAYYYLLEMI